MQKTFQMININCLFDISVKNIILHLAAKFACSRAVLANVSYGVCAFVVMFCIEVKLLN